MKRPYLYIIIALILTSLLIIYNQLGGFNDPVITYEPLKQYTFAGKRYLGLRQDQALEALFKEIREVKLKSGYAGALVMLWHGEPGDKSDSLEVFVGIELIRGDTLPVQLDRIHLEMEGLVRAAMQGHASVLPSPSSVVEKLREFAAANQYPLQDLVIDKYLSDSVVLTEIPLQVSMTVQ